MYKTVYTEHLKGKKVLLETPTGFAVFVVKDFAFKEDKNIWVHFSDPECAIQALFSLGFKKFDNISAARNGDAGPGNDLKQLIEEFCSDAETLIVQDKALKASIEKMTVDKAFITKFGFLCYLDMNLEDFPKELSRSFDEYVGIGDTIKDGLDYAKVLAMVLVSELVEEHCFSETFSQDLNLKLHQAKRIQASRKDDLTMHDVEKIMGYLDYLMYAPHARDRIIIDVKLMEATLTRSLSAVQRVDVWEPVDFNKMEFRRVLLETPSGFAMFNVCANLFCNPKDIWIYLTNVFDARKIVFAIGFVSVDEKSVARNSHDGPGDKLEQLILRFCNAKRELVVQDTQLQVVIESKLGVKCRIVDQAVEEVIWGLKYLMPRFILEEVNKVTYNYFLPLSKQLLKDLETYGINVPTSEITAEIIELFGHVKVIDKIFMKLSKDLRTKCDCYVSDIIVREDDKAYASMIAEILVPEFKEEIGLPEIAGGLGPKLMDPLKDAGKDIANCEKQEILESLKMVSYVCKEKDRVLRKLLVIEARIGIARMAVGNEAVGTDDEGKTNTKGSNKDGASGKKIETEVTNKGKTETVGSSKDDQFANNGETKPMESGRGQDKNTKKNLQVRS